MDIATFETCSSVSSDQVKLESVPADECELELTVVIRFQARRDPAGLEASQACRRSP